jgi:hypothetical protein
VDEVREGIAPQIRVPHLHDGFIVVKVGIREANRSRSPAAATAIAVAVVVAVACFTSSS